MVYEIPLKNSTGVVLLDDHVFDHLTTDSHLMNLDFINNLRKHSSGCAVFQKTWKQENGSFKTETIYLHKIIAEKFLSKQKTDKKNLVGAKNGNKLDCRLENLMYRSRATASRKRKTSSKTGYTGVYPEGKKYRAVIAINQKSVHIGMYFTPEEAAIAYNIASEALYGKNGKLNFIRSVEEIPPPTVDIERLKMISSNGILSGQNDKTS